jgi:hypothetical protein
MLEKENMLDYIKKKQLNLCKGLISFPLFCGMFWGRLLSVGKSLLAGVGTLHKIVNIIN